MQMGAGNRARRAGAADQLPGLDQVAFAYQNLILVHIQRQYAMSVIEHGEFTFVEKLFGDHRLAAGEGEDVCAGRRLRR